FGTLIHDPARSRVVQEDATEIVLTTGENLLLGALLDHAGEAMSRAQLLDLIRGREMRSYDRAVDNTISRLRQKLKSDSLPDGLIVTEWGRGYRISVPVKDLGA
ncbi:MAG TPA: winged helix-turn-helix domain-containing protein, partial [Paenirhodobacter sp.]